MTPECELQVEIAVLKERIAGSDKALVIAKDVADAKELGARAHTASLYATAIGLIGLLLGLIGLWRH